ncbi:FG-GAP repeat protein [Streptomyces sp. NPDC005951]|uniref:FG-GAP repeat protein n=1 Tax=Streptomyces sp. NPDC005951 TaxID=3154573 RepID=UPI0033D6D10F
MRSSVRPPAPRAWSLANNARRWRRSQPRRQCAGVAPASVARQPVDFNGDGYEDVIASVPGGTVSSAKNVPPRLLWPPPVRTRTRAASGSSRAAARARSPRAAPPSARRAWA